MKITERGKAVELRKKGFTYKEIENFYMCQKLH